MFPYGRNPEIGHFNPGVVFKIGIKSTVLLFEFIPVFFISLIFFVTRTTIDKGPSGIGKNCKKMNPIPILFLMELL